MLALTRRIRDDMQLTLAEHAAWKEWACRPPSSARGRRGRSGVFLELPLLVPLAWFDSGYMRPACVFADDRDDFSDGVMCSAACGSLAATTGFYSTARCCSFFTLSENTCVWLMTPLFHRKIGCASRWHHGLVSVKRRNTWHYVVHVLRQSRRQFGRIPHGFVCEVDLGS